MDYSRFTAINFLPWTPSRNPIDLFIPALQTTINDCDSGIISDGGLTGTDIRIIEGTYVWSMAVDEWIANWYLYYKIYKNPSYLSNLQTATWYQNMTGTDVSKVAMMHHHMTEAFQIGNESSLISILDDMNSVDPTSSANSLSTYGAMLDQEILIKETHKNYHLNQALIYVQNLNRGTSFDGLVMDVYLPYINTLLDTSYVLSAIEQSTLENAAALCPIEHGFAVHAARHFVDTDELYDLYEINCTITAERSLKEKQDVALDLTVSPNPSIGQMQVFGEVTGKLSLYNQVGLLIDEIDVINGSIDISNQPPGIYFIGNKKQMQKIILIK